MRILLAEDDPLLGYSLRPHRSLNVRLSDNRTMVYEPFPRQYRQLISGMTEGDCRPLGSKRAARRAGRLTGVPCFKRRLHLDLEQRHEPAI